MRYILAFLVLIGIIVALFGVVFLITRVSEKINDLHWGLKRKHPKYAKFSEFMNETFKLWAANWFSFGIFGGTKIV